MNPHLKLDHVELIVDTIFGEVTNALVAGIRVELRGFGVFFVKQRKARTGRNPRTGETVHVASKPIPFFKTSKGMHQRLSGIVSSDEDDMKD